MSDIKQEFVPLTLGGKTYDICLSLNIIDILQDRYPKGLREMGEKVQEPKELAWLVTQFINDSVDNHNDDFPEKWERVDEAWIKRKINVSNMRDVSNALLQTIISGMPKHEGDTDPNPPNPQP